MGRKPAGEKKLECRETEKILWKEQRNFERKRQAKKEKKHRKVYEILPTVIYTRKRWNKSQKEEKKVDKKWSKQQHW